MINFIDLKSQYSSLQKEIKTNIDNVLNHGQYIMGPEVLELESKLASYVDSKYCITVASGTEALLISLMALKVGPGDEVITSPFTFVSTAEVVSLLGAKPVFVDIDESNCNLNHKLLEDAISPRTKAIIPVSLYGQTCEMDEINAIANKYDLAVIEDAAQSFGAEYKGYKSCNTSLIGCTSFFPSKPLGCYGDGGAIFTSDDSIAESCKEIRVHGASKRYHHTKVGVGGRMDTIQCAIVLAKLQIFEWEVKKRIDIGNAYINKIKSNEASAKIGFIDVPNYKSCVWGQFTIAIDDRDKVIAQLSKAEIPTAIHYPMPLHMQPAYIKDCIVSKSCKVSEEMSKKVLSLPMSPYLNEADQDAIVDSLSKALTN